MFQNHLRSSIRILAKEKLYTVINAVGLAVALGTCFLIYLWVHFETSYDTYLPGSDRIYRVVTNSDGSAEQGIASTYPMVRTRILSQIPEIEESTRLFDRGFLGAKTRITYLDKVFTDNSFYYGDPTIFSVFPYKIIKGTKQNPLDKPNAVVLSEKSASRIFGEEDPIGKTITMGSSKKFEVSAVIEDIPANTHFHFDMMASMKVHPWIKGAEENVWSGVVFHTYVKLKEGISPDIVERKIASILADFPNDPDHIGREQDLALQQLSDIHLKSNLQFELGANGNIMYIYLFITIAFLILIVAIINYTNLATARHTQRFKEVAVRKVMGATRGQLIVQFVTESVVVTFIAFIIAAIGVQLVQPGLITLTGQDYLPDGLFQPALILWAAGITLIIGVLTGLLPSLALSAFHPVKLFKGDVGPGSRKNSIRKALIVTQFTVSIALTICTAITYEQIKYMQDAKLGYDLEQTIVLNIGFDKVHSKYQLLKSELLTNAAIFGATATSQLPTDIQTGENIDISSSESFDVSCVSVDKDFFRVMGVDVLQGEELISSIEESDTINHFVINESALKSIGWSESEVLNKQMSIRHGNARPGSVMGIVSDFHFQALHQAITPLVLEFNPRQFQYLLVKVKTDDIANTISFIERKWSDISQGIPFDYMFLDQQYNNLYRSEKRSGTLFIAFSIIAVVISLLGLFGLSSFSVERRAREIGVRKILGANVTDIMIVISKDFLIMLFIAFALAVPIGYYFMDTWLANFAFRTHVGPWLFVGAGMINIILGLLTLSYQGLKIAGNDPMKSLGV